jgi:lipopolysaccharide biosynthesis glycosyltransferase
LDYHIVGNKVSGDDPQAGLTAPLLRQDHDDHFFVSGVPSMSVALFFRDPRVQVALSGPRNAGGAVLIEEFFSTYGYGDCTAAQLLALADLAARCNNNDIAREALLRVIETGTREHLARYKFGRILLGEGQLAEAAAQFMLGAQADDSFPHNHMGAARALFSQGVREEAAEFAERFIGFEVRPHGLADLTILGDIADYVFDSGQRERGLPIYQFLYAIGAQQTRHVVRLAEALMGAGDYDEAYRMLHAQTARHGPDQWTDRALALCHSHQGDHEGAIALALRAVEAEPADQGFVGTYVRVLGNARDPVAIRDAMARHGHLFSPADVAELGIRLNLVEDNLSAAADIVRGADIMPDSCLFHTSIEIAYAGLNAGQPEIATALADMLSGIAPDASDVKILRIDICFRLLLWEDAGEILATMPPAEDEPPQISMKRLEYACFMGDRETAASAARQMEVLAPRAGRQVMLPVFRYYAEQQDWHAVMDRALPWIDGGLDYRQIGYVLFRAAKHSGRQDEMISAIESLADWQAHPGLVTLRNRLAYDKVATLADIDALSNEPSVAGDKFLLHKLAVRRQVIARETAAPPRQAVFLCTDRNYLCATVVALHGITQAVNTRLTDFYIVADDEVADLARASTNAFAEHGINLAIVAASDVIGTASRLLPEYGLFTSGHRLASAAYYRIYFAHYLQRLGVHERALYVDSDVVLAGRLDELIQGDLGGQPAAARLESTRPEVRRAIAHHRLADGRYFNSGVLLLDLCHPDLEGSLTASMHAVADENVQLLYHDQCALNLGFRSGFAELDQAWNYPVTEATALDEIPSNAAILHFLDRPKPWSAAYGGEAALLWFEKWRETAAFIGSEAAVELFAQIRD